MIKTKVTYLNKEIVVEEEEPSTIKELTTLIGEEGIVTNTNSNLRYRNKYPRVYKRVSMEVAKLGFPVPTVDGKPVDDIKHLKQFFTSSPENRDTLIKLFQQIAPQEPLYIRGDRSGGGRVAQGALDAATRYFAQGMDEVERVVDIIENQLPGYRVSREPELTPEHLARGIQTLQRHLQSKARAVVANL